MKENSAPLLLSGTFLEYGGYCKQQRHPDNYLLHICVCVCVCVCACVCVQASLQRSAALRGAGLLNLRLAPPSTMMSDGARARGREVGSIEELSSYNTTETSAA